MIKLLTITLLIVLCYPMVLFGQDVVPLPVPEVDLGTWAEQLMALFKLIKGGAASGLVIASAVLALLLQTLKLKILKPIIEKNRLVVFAITTTIGVIITIVTSLIAGMSFPDASMAALFTSGGAIAIYGAFRALFKKK
ncbi:MAG: hypothetical protein ACTSRG_13000 [Candidatus Helarchaeota archaeon]